MTSTREDPHPALRPVPANPAAPPASGAWRVGDPVGDRRFVEIGDLALERGGRLGPITMAFETWGQLSPEGDNAVLVLHALTGDSHVVGPAGPGHATAGWWQELIGPGRALDTDRWFVVAPNVLGGCQGTTGPSSPAADGRPYGARFPYLTVRDQVAAEVALADELGLERWALVVGGSMGGMRALEWAVSQPERVQRLLVLASTAASTGDQIAWTASQLAVIRADPGFGQGDYYDAAPGYGPHVGLGIARRIAHTTYRSEQELNLRFGRRAQAGEDPFGGGGRFAVESYLDHHGEKLTYRFDANSYLVLSEAMNSHDIGRGRGGVAAALRRVRARTAVAAFETDRLYPPHLNAEIAAGITDCAPLQVVSSPYGHDAFLVEVDRVGEILLNLLGEHVLCPSD